MTKAKRNTLVMGALVLFLTLGLLNWRLNMWSDYCGPVQGVRIEGDKTVSPTKWWNHIQLALWGWNAVTVFEVSEKDARNGYRLGYRPFEGKAKIEDTVSNARRFRVKNGHEDCTFFVIAIDGNETRLSVVARTTKSDTAYQDAPMH